MIWVFDLDNTLHNAAHAIFPEISANMDAFLMKHVSGPNGRPLSEEEADQLRRQYWQQYGATLAGVSQILDHRAKAFLSAAHQFDNLAKLIEAEKGLPVLFRRLPGRKVLLTNSAYHYSRDILNLLGLSSYFEKNIAIESMRVFGRFEVKPSRKLFRKLMVMLKTRPEKCVLVEDDIHVLKEAKAVGMKTVWVTQYLAESHASVHAYPNPFSRRRAGKPPYVDIKIPSVCCLARCPK